MPHFTETCDMKIQTHGTCKLASDYRRGQKLFFPIPANIYSSVLVPLRLHLHSTTEHSEMRRTLICIDIWLPFSPHIYVCASMCVEGVF